MGIDKQFDDYTDRERREYDAETARLIELHGSEWVVGHDADGWYIEGPLDSETWELIAAEHETLGEAVRAAVEEGR